MKGFHTARNSEGFNKATCGWFSYGGWAAVAGPSGHDRHYSVGFPFDRVGQVHIVSNPVAGIRGKTRSLKQGSKIYNAVLAAALFPRGNV